jgi:hypothetical protein
VDHSVSVHGTQSTQQGGGKLWKGGREGGGGEGRGRKGTVRRTALNADKQ